MPYATDVHIQSDALSSLHPQRLWHCEPNLCMEYERTGSGRSRAHRPKIRSAELRKSHSIQTPRSVSTCSGSVRSESLRNMQPYVNGRGDHCAGDLSSRASSQGVGRHGAGLDQYELDREPIGGPWMFSAPRNPAALTAHGRPAWQNLPGAGRGQPAGRTSLHIDSPQFYRQTVSMYGESHGPFWLSGHTTAAPGAFGRNTRFSDEAFKCYCGR
eukprot:gnl/MRDRNA2_/MRDRNA2_61686_c0_seq1.p1 gnl/MRDRNA2_/MRDRNA2_61686_c0~~gnl/MRDRNA2_/MRDRNA2_61686_c0_seq1.p1  ORF type:complete len:214 (+),score=2.54 gnl/MRDRNA2_/MRDRNA2_61686_c0_seq1:86-727(+)